MTRFGARWGRASDAALPFLDIEKGAERLVRTHKALKPRRRRGLRLRMAAAALTGMAVVILSIRAIHPYKFTVDHRPATAGIRLSESAADQVLRFSEGSTITLAPGSDLAVREVGEHGARLAIDRGAVHIDIVPRADAKWSVEAGPFVVTVLGTTFNVEWTPQTQRFVVSVTRGTVFVNGPMLGEGQTVAAGTRCTVDWKQARLTIEAADHPQESHARPLQRDGAKHVATWQELECSGEFERAVEEAERIGLDAIYDSANADDLMSLARAARFAGREDVSKGALLTCRRRFPASRDSAMAAYLVGRNAPPTEAVRWFTMYLAEQPDGVWAREASGRLIEAHRANGNLGAARQAATQYLARFPAGSHAEFAKMLLDN